MAQAASTILEGKEYFFPIFFGKRRFQIILPMSKGRNHAQPCVVVTFQATMGCSHLNGGLEGFIHDWMGVIQNVHVNFVRKIVHCFEYII